MKELISKLKAAPLGFIKRGLSKTIIGPIVYGRGNDYDASRYWRDRFLRYGESLKGVGNEGFSEKDNERDYAGAARVFLEVCEREKIDFTKARVLEVGCGNGFYTQLISDGGVSNYLGVDITDVLFPKLKEKFPQFTFTRKDITSDEISGNFDLILMIDVIEHIVTDEKLTAAMESIKKCLSPTGVFLIAPVVLQRKKKLFYVNFWSVDDIKSRFVDFVFGELVEFRNGYLLTVRSS